MELGGLEARNWGNINTSINQGYARLLEGRGVEWDGDNNVEHMCMQMKWTMVESAREVCYVIQWEWGNEPKECMVEWWGKSCSLEKRDYLEGGVGS